uniref:coactosin-like protein n=1 Tax=Styela clava TaxID=7725 RepID=UPI00193AB3AA|nr:coactosin-like protein [Styela clava]
MAKNYDEETIYAECDIVRCDDNSTNWVSFVYDEKTIVIDQKGEDIEELLKHMTKNKDRVFAYIRVETGDEMSKRQKFAFLTFIGTDAKPLNKARVSTDSKSLQSTCPDVAVNHFMDGEPDPLEEIIEKVRKAGGANYNAQA